MVRTLVQLMRTLDKMPEEVNLNYVLLFRDTVRFQKTLHLHQLYEFY